MDYASTINEILHSAFDMDMDMDITEENADKHNLFGHQIRMSARDMVYLVHILEQRFGICFVEDDFNNEAFYTVKGLSDIINKRVKKDD